MCMTCNSIDPAAFGPAPSRRSILAGIGAVAASLGLAACGDAGQSTGPSAAPLAGPRGQDSKLEAVLLGTMAGPPVEPDRAGISTALVVDGHTYLVDCGRSATTQYMNRA